MDSIGIQIAGHLLNQTRYFFYLANPYDTMFPDMNVPRYVTEMFPIFILLAIIENVIRFSKGKTILRLNDSIASLSCGLVQDCFRIHIRSLEVLCYCLVYDHFRITTLPWNSIQTWFYCFLAVDIGFYFAHRIAHEVNMIWAIHQAHHSGEDFTIVAALRQAVLQPFAAWLTYIPLAVAGIPPQIFLVHMQLTELYMLWIHTEAIESLGPLEWILNSPSHHRVHHARNRNYIDKNYGGVFIIWDRLLGTFQQEDPDDPPVYGLVKPVESYDVFFLQFHTWIGIYRNICSIPKWQDKIMVPFNGPGWSPGKPRLGYIEDIPDVPKPAVYWDPKISRWKQVYVIWHFATVIAFYHELSHRTEQLSQPMIFLGVSAILISVTTIGRLLENRDEAICLELIRCSIFLAGQRFLLPLTSIPQADQSVRFGILLIIQSTFIVSIAICILHEFYRIYQHCKWHLKQRID